MLTANIPFLHRTVSRRRIERALTQRLARAEVPIEGLRVVDAPASRPRHHLGLQREGRRLFVFVNSTAIASDVSLIEVFSSRAPAIIDPFVRAHVSEVSGDISDGEESGPGKVAFSATDSGAILIPDSEFYRSRGYHSYRAAAGAWQTGWTARREEIVWRGSTTGRGQISTPDMAVDDAGLIQRTRMCLMLRTTPGVDARFVIVVQSADPTQDGRCLVQAGILGGHIDPMTWLVRKFAIDIDGNSNAWSNLFTRLLAGCCVLKVASPFGYRQWYYDALRPWEHFVPVEADLSDLHERIAWCRTHDRQCAEIAAAGRDFAVRRTFETEMTTAVESLNIRCRSAQVQ